MQLTISNQALGWFDNPLSAVASQSFNQTDWTDIIDDVLSGDGFTVSCKVTGKEETFYVVISTLWLNYKCFS